MKAYLSGAAGGAIAAAALFVSLGATPAQAQMPGGSYLQSCTDVRAFGDRVVATCRRSDGSWARTAINGVHDCVGGLANADGRLTCGRRGTEFGWNRRHHEWEGYGSSIEPRHYRHDYRGGPGYYDYNYGR